MGETMLQVLLIEDDEADCIGLQRAFDLIGVKYNLHIAETGEKGWKNLTKTILAIKKLPIVLLDINLPMQSGIKTLELIRSDPMTKNARVIVWSSSKRQEDVDAANSLDIEGFLLKSTTGSTYMKAATMLIDYWRIDNQ